MDYRILGETLPAVEVRLQTGEAMYTQMCIRDSLRARINENPQTM